MYSFFCELSTYTFSIFDTQQYIEYGVGTGIMLHLEKNLFIQFLKKKNRKKRKTISMVLLLIADCTQSKVIEILCFRGSLAQCRRIAYKYLLCIKIIVIVAIISNNVWKI